MDADGISRRAFLGGAAGTGLTAVIGVAPTSAADTPPTPPTLPVTVLVRGGLPPESAAEIQTLGQERVRLVIAPDEAAWRRALPDADAIFGSFSRDDLKAAKKLRWAQYGAAGVEHILYPELVSRPIILTNAKGCYAPAIAEHIVGFLIALSRSIGAQTKRMQSHQWGNNSPMREVRGMTMGIVGFGGIGRETARRAQALGLRVVAADIQPFQPEQTGHLAEMIYPVDGGGLERLLAESDVVVSAAPHTKRSEGMFDEARFAKAKDGALFINVSRGKLVKTPALVTALKSGKLAGAGLDVTDPEPLPADHPLWEMPNVLITSHIAGQSQYSGGRTLAVFTENVRRFTLGLPLLNVVDKEAGF